jgi:predicted Zn-dependent protease with MMP-like domain
MVDVDPERFEVMVSDALDGIPAELGELMSNVAVTVQHDSGPAGRLGLYQGGAIDAQVDVLRRRPT